jgi:hypothetical protein
MNTPKIHFDSLIQLLTTQSIQLFYTFGIV